MKQTDWDLPYTDAQYFVYDLEKKFPSLSAYMTYRKEVMHDTVVGISEGETQYKLLIALLDDLFEQDITKQYINDLIPLVAYWLGPRMGLDAIRASYYKHLIGGNKFHPTKSINMFPTFRAHWNYELLLRDKLASAYSCSIIEDFMFDSSIHPIDYNKHIRTKAKEYGAFGFRFDNDITYFFENEEDEILLRISQAHKVLR